MCKKNKSISESNFNYLLQRLSNLFYVRYNFRWPGKDEKDTSVLLFLIDFTNRGMTDVHNMLTDLGFEKITEELDQQKLQYTYRSPQIVVKSKWWRFWF